MKLKIILTTDRLILRHFVPTDAQRWVKISKDEKVMEWVGGVQEKEQAIEYLQHLQDLYVDHGYGLYAVVHKQDKNLIGFCGVKDQHVNGKMLPELGYRLDSNYWGQGLATEAALAVKGHAKEVLKLPTLISIILPTNIASKRVSEKIGGTPVGDAHRFGRTVLIYKYW